MSRGLVTVTAASSHEVVLLFRVLFALSYRAHWVTPIPPRSVCFQMTLAVFLAAPSPVHLRARVHPLVSFASSPESFLSPTCQLTAINQHLPWGFVPSSRQQYERSTYRRASHVSPTFRPQCFAHSRRLSPAPTWWTYFIPHAVSKVHLTGGFPDTQPV